MRHVIRMQESGLALPAEENDQARRGMRRRCGGRRKILGEGLAIG